MPGVFGRTWADGPGSLFSLLYKAGHPDFRTLVADRLHKHYANGGAMTDEAILARLQERLNEVQLSMIPEIARWGGPNNTDSYQTVPEWQAKVDFHVNSWIPGHSAARVAQFKAAGFLPATDAPAFSQHGGAVAQGYPLTMQANAPVYYTTDGTDPRLPGGALSPSALLYEPPVLTNPVSLVGDTTGVRGIVPADNSVDATWTAAGFDDSAWASAAGAGVGYDEDTTYVPYIDLNVGAAMNDTSTTAYLRYAFTVDDPAALTNLTLAMRYDDGFVAYLNGTRIASANAPATLDFQAGATAQHADGEAVGFAPVAYEHPDPASLLVAGQNVLAIHGLNYLITSSDFLIEPQLTAYEIEDIGGSPPVAINAPTVVKARAQSAGGEWSALTEAFFAIGPAVQPGDVGVAEIHYNPDGQSESTEFIELINLADHAINLRGALFTDGIEFAFPALRDTLLAPGQRFLLAGSRYGMDGEYGPGLPVGGLFRDNLSNDGETLTLEDGQGNVLFTLTYNDQLPWPTAADGDGYSLANINPTGDPADPANWRSGAATGGSPGAPDPGSAFAGDPQVDGDFDSIPALAEFAMGTSDAAADANPIALTPPAPGESGYTFSFPRDPTALGVRLFPEVSGDMIGWDQDSPALTYLGETRDASGIATVRYRLDPAGALQHFVRLVAEPTPVLP
ncbi:MAG: lamin tail domain-containing protein [Verrucomicrobiales bacterium]